MLHFDLVDGSALASDEVLALYDSVGWTAFTRDPGKRTAALAGSSAVVTTREEGRLVGLARVVSGGASVCYLQKVLMTDDEPGQKAFYESLGFTQVEDPLRAFARFD